MSAERNCPRKIIKSIRTTVWKTRKRIRKTIRNAFEKCLAPLRPPKHFSPALFNKFSKSFSPPKICTKKSFFFTARLCRGGHANDFWEGDATKHFFQWKKGFSVKRGEAIQWIRGWVRISTGKAIQWRGSGHSLNRWTLKTEKLLSSSPSRKSVPMLHRCGG